MKIGKKQDCAVSPLRQKSRIVQMNDDIDICRDLKDVPFEPIAVDSGSDKNEIQQAGRALYNSGDTNVDVRFDNARHTATTLRPGDVAIRAFERLFLTQNEPFDGEVTVLLDFDVVKSTVDRQRNDLIDSGSITVTDAQTNVKADNNERKGLLIKNDGLATCAIGSVGMTFAGSFLLKPQEAVSFPNNFVGSVKSRCDTGKTTSLSILETDILDK